MSRNFNVAFVLPVDKILKGKIQIGVPVCRQAGRKAGRQEGRKEGRL